MAEVIAIIHLVDSALGVGCKSYAFLYSVKDASVEVKHWARNHNNLEIVLPVVSSQVNRGIRDRPDHKPRRCLSRDSARRSPGVSGRVLKALEPYNDLKQVKKVGPWTNNCKKSSWTFKASYIKRQCYGLKGKSKP